MSETKRTVSVQSKRRRKAPLQRPAPLVKPDLPPSPLASAPLGAIRAILAARRAGKISAAKAVERLMLLERKMTARQTAEDREVQRAEKDPGQPKSEPRPPRLRQRPAAAETEVPGVVVANAPVEGPAVATTAAASHADTGTKAAVPEAEAGNDPASEGVQAIDNTGIEPRAAGLTKPYRLVSSEKDLNLVDWAARRVRCRFALVRDLVQKLHGRRCTTALELRSYLLEIEVVSMWDLKDALPHDLAWRDLMERWQSSQPPEADTVTTPEDNAFAADDADDADLSEGEVDVDPHDEAAAADVGSEIDLRRWMRGDASYKFLEVRRAIFRRYGVNVLLPAEARQYLADERILPLGERKRIMLARKRRGL